MPQLEKYRSIDAPYDRDEVIYLDDSGFLQTIEVDGVQQKVLSKEILKNSVHHLHIPFLTGSIGDAEKLKIIMNSFCSFKRKYKVMDLLYKAKIIDDVTWTDKINWLIYCPKKAVSIMFISDNKHSHYISYYLDNNNETYKVKGKFVKLDFDSKKLNIYKKFEFLVKNDKIHNEENWAAKVSVNGSRDIFFWMQNNELHNMDGPAVIHGKEKNYFTYGRLYKP